MSISLDKKLLVSSLLPQTLIQGLQEEKVDETSMCALSLLIVNTALGAVKVLQQCSYKHLDANPGEGGCQNRALELRRLSMMDLREECSELKKTASAIKGLISKRKGCAKERSKCTPHVFFQGHLASLTISKEMEFIVHCYLSTVIRTPCQTLANGIIVTKSDVSKLSILSDKIAALNTGNRKKIVEENQKTLSQLSVEAMHFSAMQTFSLEPAEKRLLVTMLSPAHTRLFTPDTQYEPKAFGCLFYVVKTVLVRLREEQGIVCLKSIVKTAEPFHLLLQSKGPGEEFHVLPDKAYTSLSPLTAVVVFEAVIHVEKKAAAKLLMEQGFTPTILMQAAKEAPYEPTSSLDDVKEPKAVEEITAYKERSITMEDFILLDHVYLNTLGAEMKELS